MKALIFTPHPLIIQLRLATLLKKSFHQGGFTVNTLSVLPVNSVLFEKRFM